MRDRKPASQKTAEPRSAKANKGYPHQGIRTREAKASWAKAAAALPTMAAPSKHAAARKRKPETQQAAHKAPATNPGLANGAATYKPGKVERMMADHFTR